MSQPDVVEAGSPAERRGRAVDGVEVLAALSPSRAADFMACPLLYRFRSVDRLPEPPSPDATRGTLVHRVLEQLFDLPAPERTPEQAAAMLEPAWAWLLEHEPDAAGLFADDAEREAWLTTCREALAGYFTLEDPRSLEPSERELYVEALLDSKLLLRGFVDRVDVAPDGAVRIVDYKGLALDTPLPTPSGWTTMGLLEVGTEILGADGRPTRVIGKSAVHARPCYRVTLRDGSSVVSDNIHQWRVVTVRRQVETVHLVSTDQLFEMHRALAAEGRTQSMFISAAEPLQLPAAPLPVDPWLLGAWLGDGDRRGGHLTVGRQDLADMLVMIKEHWHGDVSVTATGTAHHLALSRRRDACMYGHTDFVPGGFDRRKRRCAHEWKHHRLPKTNLPLTALLRDLGVLGSKHIPKQYLRAAADQRIALLRGLMDTDGWWNRTRKRAGFTTTDDQLAHDVVELLRTLGVNPSHFEKPYLNPVRAPRTWHVIEFSPVDFNPFALPRKADACTVHQTGLRRTLAARRVISAVERIESVPTQCIVVDAPDSMFLSGLGFVPTHNSGRSPRVGFEAKALFQLKFYALALWRTRGVVPRLLQLVYLGNRELVTYEPDELDLLATERKVEAVWRAIRYAEQSGDWRPQRSRLCDWCAHQAICPAWGGTPPPLPRRPA